MTVLGSKYDQQLPIQSVVLNLMLPSVVMKESHGCGSGTCLGLINRACWHRHQRVGNETACAEGCVWQCIKGPSFFVEH